MESIKLTFEDLPEAVMKILHDINDIKNQLSGFLPTKVVERKMLNIMEAAQLVKKSKSTIYKLVHQKKIPCYKCGKQLYFFEDELMKWITECKSKTYSATLEEVGQLIHRNKRIRVNK